MSKTDPMWVFENYATAAELIDELENSLAQRDAEVERLKAAPCECGASVGYVSGEKYEAAQQRIRDYRKRIAALESQQSASVVGEREAFDAWFRRVKGLNDTVDTTFVSEAFFPYKAFKFGIEYGSAALSPAGGHASVCGGVRMPEHKHYHDYLPLYDKGYSTGYNDALRDVLHLNAGRVTKC